MKKYLLAAVATLELGGIATAQTVTCQDFMGTRYCNGPNGYRPQTSPLPGGASYGFDNHKERDDQRSGGGLKSDRITPPSPGRTPSPSDRDNGTGK